MPDEEKPSKRTEWKRSHIRGEQGESKPDHGNAAVGTREREERITGTTGVRNKKGEMVDQGSTTSLKGGRVATQPDQDAQRRDVGRGSRTGGQDPDTQLKAWREKEEKDE